jgi:transcriptional regulator with XRE-family HTH domain
LPKTLTQSAEEMKPLTSFAAPSSVAILETPAPKAPPDSNQLPDAIEDEQIEEIIGAKAIGQRIRRLRLKRSMGLVELGQFTGLSASFLSQLETGRVIPTLRNLSRIALVFNKDLTYFFEETNHNFFRSSRGADRVRLSIGDKASPHLISESMSVLIPNRSLVPCIAEFLPNPQNNCFEPHIFRGQEFVYVIDGSVELRTEHDRQILEEGDIAWIDGNTKRNYSCKDHKPSKAMIITCPQ